MLQFNTPTCIYCVDIFSVYSEQTLLALSNNTAPCFEIRGNKVVVILQSTSQDPTVGCKFMPSIEINGVE